MGSEMCIRDRSKICATNKLVCIAVLPTGLTTTPKTMINIMNTRIKVTVAVIDKRSIQEVNPLKILKNKLN